MAASLHKSQILLLALGAFMAGVFAASLAAIPLAGTLALLLAGTIVLAVSSYTRLKNAGFLTGILVFVFTFGVWRYESFSTGRGLLLQFTGQEYAVPVTMEGYVDGDATFSKGTGRFPFRVKRILAGNRAFETDERTLVLVRERLEYEYGRTLSLNGPVNVPENFDTFDYVSYLKKDGIRTIADYPEVSEIKNLELGSPERLKLNIYKNIFLVRDAFQTAVNRSIPEPAASYVNGILLGVRQDISQDLKDSFSRTGTSHILAISGYNIAIIAHALLWLLVFAVRRRPAFWVTLGVIAVFTVMTGASASVVRAAVMGLLVLFASSYGRLSDVTGGIVLAGGVMVLANPLVLRFDIGFQLSFLAVLGLVYIQPGLAYLFRRMPKAGPLKEILLATLAAQLAVLPLLTYYFGELSLVALPVNLLVLPLVPAAMTLGFVTGVAGMLLAPLGQLAGFFAWAVAYWQLGVIRLFAGLPFASLSVPVHLITMLLLYAAIIFGVVRFNKKYGKQL